MIDEGGPAGLGAAVLRAWATAAAQVVRDQRAVLDELNVFPVADSDTGTNLTLTLDEADRGVQRLAPAAPADAVAAALCRGALVGARGNSGVILSQYLRGLLRSEQHGQHEQNEQNEQNEQHEQHEQHGGARRHPLAAALDRAAVAARSSVAGPVEGTVLSVADAVARGAGGLGAEAHEADVLAAGLRDGFVALDATPGQLPELRAAGVLDAGGWGLLLVLGALLGALLDPRLGGSRGGADAEHSRLLARRPSMPSAGHPAPAESVGVDADEFEVMYVLAAADAGAPEPARCGGSGCGPAGRPADTAASSDAVAAAVRAALVGVGRSVAVVAGDGLWQAHVHTERPAAVLALEPPPGTERAQVRIRHLVGGHHRGGHPAGARPAVGLVAVTAAPGLAADLARAGAVVVVVREPVAGPGEDLDHAVEDAGGERVLVLSSVDLGTWRPRAGGPAVEVVTGLGDVQVVAAAATLATASPGTPAVEVAAALRATAQSVRTARLDVGTARGEVDGAALAAHDGAAVGPDAEAEAEADADAEAAVAAALELLGDDGELLTVLLGAHVPGAVAEAVVDAVAAGRPEADVVVLAGVLDGHVVALGVE